MSIAGLIVGAFRRLKLSAAIVAVCVAVSIVAALLMKPVYRAEVVVAPTDATGVMSGLAGQLGGLASLAGLPLGQDDHRAEAMGVLHSRLLMQRLIERQQLLPVLFEEKWDAVAKNWRAGTKPPTMGDALRLFDQNILSVRTDLKSSLVTVRIEWRDRKLCAEWAAMIVDMANEEMRRRAVEESTASLAVLEREFAAAENVSLRNAISNLMEAQMKSRTLAEVRKQFAFKVVDPPLVPDADKRVRPTRTLIVIVGGLFGALLAVVVAALLDAWRRLREKNIGL